MPLRKQKASIKFSKGVQGKVDHKVLPKEHLTLLENGRFSKLGAINKRNGYALIDEASSDVVSYKNSLVTRNCIVSDRATGTLSSSSIWSQSSSKFVGDLGYSDGIDWLSMPVSRGSEYGQEDSAVCISGNGEYACVTFIDVSWDETNDKKVYNKRFSIVDRRTNSLIASDIKLGAAENSGNSGRRMRTVWIGAQSKFYIFGEDEQAFKVWVVDPNAATIEPKNTSGTASAEGSTLIATANYPIEVDSDYVLTDSSFDVTDSATTSKANIYVTYANKSSISAATRANPCVVTCSGHPFVDGDYVFISGVVGMTQLNGNRYLVAGKTTNTFQLTSTDSSSYGVWSSGGTAKGIYERYYQFTAPSTLSSSLWSQTMHSVNTDLKIHKRDANGSHANKLAFACQTDFTQKIKSNAEAATSYSEGAGTKNDQFYIRGDFVPRWNPEYSSGQDVDYIFEVGLEAFVSDAGIQQIYKCTSIHADPQLSVRCPQEISRKARLAFVLGTAKGCPPSIGIFQDDNPGQTVPDATSEAAIQTISIWDMDTSEPDVRFSSDVTNNDSAYHPRTMFNGSSTEVAKNFCRSTSNEKLTATFEPPLIYSSTLKFYCDLGAGVTWQINSAGGFAATSGSGVGAHTITASGGGTLSKIEFYASGSIVDIYAIEIDGTKLKDAHAPFWKRAYLRSSVFLPAWRTDTFRSATIAGLDELNGAAVAIPTGHSYERFGPSGALVLNTTTRLYDFRRYNEERVDVPAPSVAMLHDVLYVADKELFQFDGEKWHAVNFANRTQVGLDKTSYSGSDALTDGAYYYKGVYEWVDAQGNLHQSEPSAGVTVTADSSNRKIAVTATSLEVSSYNFISSVQPGYQPQIKLAIYRTQSGGSLYNHIKSVLATPRAAAGYISFTDETTDAEASLGKFLYTDSGELANRPPPASARYVVAHRDRLFVIGKDDVVYYSKIASDGFGVAFNEALYIKTPDNITDPPTALGSMDGNLFIFTEKSIYIVGGEGPDNTGAGGFYDVKKIPTNVGAVKGSPVKLINDGLLFVSENNTGTRINQLGRNMSITPIGSPIEDILNPEGGTPYMVRDIVTHSEDETVYFLLSQVSGTPDGVKLLTYNFVFKQWGVDKLLDTYGAGAGGSLAFSSVAGIRKLYIGLIHHATNQNPRTYLEDSGFKDNSVYVPMKVKTAWINLGGIQSYQRVYNFHILGESKDKHTLTVNVYYDYVTTDPDSYTFTTSSAADAKLQFRGHLTKQKCQAIQFEVLDADNAGTTDDGYAITEIALEIGLKSDGYRKSNVKLNTTSTVGSN